MVTSLSLHQSVKDSRMVADTSEDDVLEISSQLSDADLEAICEAANVIACECPSYLVQLLAHVREFRRYTVGCVERFPRDVETHHWLSTQADQMEALLSQTLVELMRRENLLNDQNQLSLNQLAERSRALALNAIRNH